MKAPEIPTDLHAALERAFVTVMGQARQKVVDSFRSRAQTRPAAKVLARVAAAGSDDSDGDIELDEDDRFTITDAGTLFSVDDWNASIADVMPEVLGRVIVNSATQAAAGYAFDVSDPAMSDLVAEHVNAISSWGADLRVRVTNIVSAGMDSGLSIDDMADQLSSSGPLTDAAATRIARGEAIAASNGGTLAGWDQAGVAGKTWMATGDDRTRPDHITANGQTVGLHDPFDVGGEEADFPGDPNLSPEQRCECRCTMTSVEADGSEDQDADDDGSDDQDDEGDDSGLTASAQPKEHLMSKRKMGRFTVVRSHEADTSDARWVLPEHRARVAAKADPSYYRRLYAQRDGDRPIGEASSWRLLHHEVAEDGTPGPANVHACIRAIGQLNGGGRGVAIPAKDRQGVYNHLAGHVRAAGQVPPEFIANPTRGDEFDDNTGDGDTAQGDQETAPSSPAVYEPAAYTRGATETVECPGCSKFDDQDATWCDQCGLRLAGNPAVRTPDGQPYQPAAYDADDGDTVTCPGCGKGDAPDASFCDQCGIRLAGNPEVEPPGSSSQAATGAGTFDAADGLPDPGTGAGSGNPDAISGAMIALFPDDPTPLAMEGGEDPTQLHITCLYLGDASGFQDPDMVQALREAVGTFAATTFNDSGQAGATAFASSSFGGPADEDAENNEVLPANDAAVLLMQGDDLETVSEELVDPLVDVLSEAGIDVPDDFPVWFPHITIGYGLDPASLSPLVGAEVTFSTISLVIGADRVDWALGQDNDDADQALNEDDDDDGTDDGDIPGADLPVTLAERRRAGFKDWGRDVKSATEADNSKTTDANGAEIRTGAEVHSASDTSAKGEVTADHGDGNVNVAWHAVKPSTTKEKASNLVKESDGAKKASTTKDSKGNLLKEGDAVDTPAGSAKVSTIKASSKEVATTKGTHEASKVTRTAKTGDASTSKAKRGAKATRPGAFAMDANGTQIELGDTVVDDEGNQGTITNLNHDGSVEVTWEPDNSTTTEDPSTLEVDNNEPMPGGQPGNQGPAGPAQSARAKGSTMNAKTRARLRARFAAAAAGPSLVDADGTPIVVGDGVSDANGDTGVVATCNDDGSVTVTWDADGSSSEEDPTTLTDTGPAGGDSGGGAGGSADGAGDGSTGVTDSAGTTINVGDGVQDADGNTGEVTALNDDGTVQVTWDTDGSSSSEDPSTLTDTGPAGVGDGGAGFSNRRQTTGRATSRRRARPSAHGRRPARFAARVDRFGIVESPGDGKTYWQGVLTVEGAPSGDGRQIQPGALTWRELPLTLMAMFENPVGGEGHDGASIAGNITHVWREGDEIWGGGELDTNGPIGAETERLIAERMLRGISVDLDMMEVDYENPMPEGDNIEDILEWNPGLMLVTSARIMGATVCSFPAFQEAQLALVDELSPAAGSEEMTEPQAIAASAGGRGATGIVFTPFSREPAGHALVAGAGGGSQVPIAPPASWFTKTAFTEAVPVRISAEGRISGHVAAWGECHIGFAGRCVTPPRSQNNYGCYRTGQVITAEGTVLNTGPLVMDTVHPDLKMAASDAGAFYAHTGSAVGDVAVYEDEWGIAIAGAIRPSATPEQVRAVRGSDWSPDWRPYRNRRELMALLAVNNTGFKVPAIVAAAGEAMAGPRPSMPGRPRALMDPGSGHVTALVAAGMVRHHAQPASLAEQLSSLATRVDRMERRERDTRASKARATAKGIRRDRARRMANEIAASEGRRFKAWGRDLEGEGGGDNSKTEDANGNELRNGTEVSKASDSEGESIGNVVADHGDGTVDVQSYDGSVSTENASDLAKEDGDQPSMMTGRTQDSEGNEIQQGDSVDTPNGPGTITGGIQDNGEDAINVAHGDGSSGTYQAGDLTRTGKGSYNPLA